MKRLMILALSVLGASPLAFAQNLNPEVQVTNDYRSRIADSVKKDLPMQVPDSLNDFNLHFDYAVFDRPYRGAYEFTPYSIKTAPETSGSDAKRFYLRAGAGYPLMPVLKAVWTPTREGRSRISVHQDLEGYIGNYTSASGSSWSGRDLSENFGVDGRHDFSRAVISWALDYDGLFNSDNFLPASYNSGKACIRVASGEASTRFFYDISARYSYSSDLIHRSFGDKSLGESAYEVKGTIGPIFTKKFKLLVDFQSMASSYNRTYSDLVFNSVLPKAALHLGAFDVTAGVNLNFGQGVTLYPDIRASLALGKAARIRASYSGGRYAFDYSFYRRSLHWFTPAWTGQLPVSSEKLNARLGIDGSIAGYLQYDLSAGYVKKGDAPVETFKSRNSTYVSGLAFVDYGEFQADLKLAWKSERIEIDGKAAIRKADLTETDDYLTPAIFTGSVKATYNWRRRLYVGVWCSGRSDRLCKLGALPAYVNLGAGAEYRFRSHLSFFLQGGNFLNHKINDSPTHIAPGINFTGGICLAL